MSIEDYASFLKKQKVKLLGFGMFASVYQHPTIPDMVAKLYDDDEAYDRYVEWCLSNQQNPFVPKIYSVHDYPEFKIVFMEKLKECDQSKFELWMKSEFVLDDLTPGFISAKVLARTLQNRTFTDEKDARFLAVLDFVQQQILINDYELDLHSGNVMMRGKEFVITDPLSW